jgi:tetratricopeptide (TPR) repeat protein
MPERHRALRSTIDWSFALLNEQERRSFLDLAVFHGGGRLEAVEAVLDSDDDVLDALTALVNHSLVVNREDPDGQPRFVMLQTIRDYALEALRQDGAREDVLRDAHADHFLEVVEQLGSSEGTAEQQQIQRDLDNVRAALGFWLRDRRDDGTAGDKALRMATAMSTYWYRHGASAEGYGYLERALKAAPSPSPALRAKALRGLGVMCEARQELGRARELLTEAIALYRELGDRAGEARALNSLGVVDRSAGRPEEAEQLMREAIRIREELGTPDDSTGALNNLGILLLDRGAWEEGAALFSRTRALDEQHDDDWGIAVSNLNLSVAYLLGGRPEEALEPLRRAVTGFAELEDGDGLVEGLEAASGMATATADYRSAARLAGAADAARASLGIPGSPIDRVHFERWLDEARRHLPAAELEALRREGRAFTIEQATRHALDEVLKEPADQAD